MRSDKSAPEADGVKHSKIEASWDPSLEGAGPNTKRKRGWHRARKRGAFWVQYEDAMKGMRSSLARELYCDPSLPNGVVRRMVGLKSWFP